MGTYLQREIEETHTDQKGHVLGVYSQVKHTQKILPHGPQEGNSSDINIQLSFYPPKLSNNRFQGT